MINYWTSTCKFKIDKITYSKCSPEQLMTSVKINLYCIFNITISNVSYIDFELVNLLLLSTKNKEYKTCVLIKVTLGSLNFQGDPGSPGDKIRGSLAQSRGKKTAQQRVKKFICLGIIHKEFGHIQKYFGQTTIHENISKNLNLFILLFFQKMRFTWSFL